MTTKERSRVYFDISVGKAQAGRVVFELVCNKDDMVVDYTD